MAREESGVSQLVATPLRAKEWEKALHGHPDQEFVAYLLHGINFGYRIRFDHGLVKWKSAKRNMQSAYEEPSVIEAYWMKEVECGRVLGPLPLEGAARPTSTHISRFGVIPKPHQPGKWRLIVDLSHPKGASVNDGVEASRCSLSYTSVEEAAAIVLNKGQRAELAKADIASAYRIIPRGSTTLGHEMERTIVYRHQVTIQAKVSTKGIHSSSRWAGMDCQREWRGRLNPLFR